MNFFNVTLTLSLALCLSGLLFRVAVWVRRSLPGSAHSPAKRVVYSLKETLRILFSPKIGAVLLAFFRDSLLQLHLLQKSPLRWGIHFTIFAGFMALVLMHAMDGVTAGLMPGYEPTLDPYQFLRNLFGVMVLAGLAGAAVRRWRNKGMRRTTGSMDWFALALVGSIVVSGFALEAVKMSSQQVFERMVEDFSPFLEDEELAALQAYWSGQGVVFDAGAQGKEASAAMQEQGEEVNENYCGSCHANTASAFVSRPLAMGIAPAASALDAANAHETLWYLHVLLTFFGLAWLPFGKMLHVVTTPLNLTVRRVAVSSGPQEMAAGLGVDACTHCGACSAACSVLPAFLAMGNRNVLPSEKLISLRRDAAGRLSDRELAAYAEGSFICTECHRCTEVCPSRIDLQQLWLHARKELITREQADPHGLIVRRTAAAWSAYFQERIPQGANVVDTRRPVNLTDRRESFWPCIQCTTCTSVCPVVAAADDPVHELDLTPQQIMNLMRMGLKDLALGARMVWSCVTCYKCQENCPQGVRVADVLYELRNIAAERMRPEPSREDEDTQKGAQ